MNAENFYYQSACFFKDGAKKKAKEFAKKALTKDKNHSKSFNILGVLAYEENDFKSAKKLYQSAINADSKNAEAHNNLGNLFTAISDIEQAEISYLNSISANSHFLDAHYNLGSLYKTLKDYEKANIYFDNVIALNPNFAGTYLNLGLIAKDEKRYDEALKLYLKCIELGEYINEAKLNIAVIDVEQNRYESSEKLNLEVLSQEPNNALARNNLGRIYKETMRFEDALAQYAIAVRINPKYGEAYSNIAVCLYELRQAERAKTSALLSIELAPNSAVCYSNLAIILKAYGDLNGALQCLQKSYELEPSNDTIRTNFAVALLSSNDYKNGLALYSARPISRLICDKPIWLGEDISNKTILVYHEQGFGDTIHFARLLPKLKTMAKKVLFMPQDALYRLCESSSLGVCIVKKEDILADKYDFDYHIALLDLMPLLKIFNPQDALELKYINVNETKKASFANRLPKDKLKVGVAWKGSKVHTDDRLRSIDVKIFKKLFLMDNISLVSLQKEASKEELEELDIINFADELNDFADTAALIDALDLVVCVDTSVAHLSATLGKPTWILTAHSPDWRWGYDKKTKWYESVTLFRRIDMFDWSSTFDELIDELKLFERPYK